MRCGTPARKSPEARSTGRGPTSRSCERIEAWRIRQASKTGGGGEASRRGIGPRRDGSRRSLRPNASELRRLAGGEGAGGVVRKRAEAIEIIGPLRWERLNSGPPDGRRRGLERSDKACFAASRHALFTRGARRASRGSARVLAERRDFCRTPEKQGQGSETRPREFQPGEKNHPLRAAKLARRGDRSDAQRAKWRMRDPKI